MTKDDLKAYIDGLDEDAEIIVITKREQVDVIPTHSEQIRLKDRIFWVIKKLVDGSWKVAVVWILFMDLFPDDVPKPKAVFLAARDKIEYVLKHTDYNFPYHSHDKEFPYVAFEFNGTTHFLPPSGLSPDVIRATGSFHRSGAV